jgi:hypothetical protein
MEAMDLRLHRFERKRHTQMEFQTTEKKKKI